MSLKARFIVGLSVIIAVSLAAALWTIALRVNAGQERQFDDALRREAWQETREIADGGGARLRISPRLGPSPDDVGPLTKFAVLYGADDSILDATESWDGAPPARGRVPAELGDFHHRGRKLRGLVSAIPGRPNTSLLLAAPRRDLDEDALYLARTMIVVFVIALCCTVLMTSVLVGRLTKVHDGIARVARRVAAEDISARIGPVGGAPDIAQLATDVDAMIERIEQLLRSRSDFIAHAAHELRSPLTALYGELSNTMRRERSPQEYRDATMEALDATRRLMVLADDLLALARVGRGGDEELRRVRLVDCVDEAVAVVAREARERNVRLDVDIEDFDVMGRSLDLARMLRNLVENAVAHSPDGASIEVRAAQDAGVGWVSVRDFGPGVADDDAVRIFQPFFRGSRERASGRGGTGLGLAIASEIAKQHPGGTLELVSPDGPGACFRVTLASVSAT
ncbi:MAG: ATP-binding protein [Nannocystaceae bacterium]|nr:HAMP domain-containing histidine kinase [bacterium]